MTVTANKGFLALIGVVVVLALAGCGKKSSPDHPSGTGYPSTYPYASPHTGPEPKSQDQPEKTKDGKKVSPLGFPLENPNRPTY